MPSSPCFHVLEGRPEPVLDGQTRLAAPGDLTRLPMGAPHGFHDRSGAPVCALGRVAPGRRA